LKEKINERAVAHLNNDKWVLCPVCGNKTRIKVRPDTVLENFPLFCPKCKRETVISLKGQNMAVVGTDKTKELNT